MTLLLSDAKIKGGISKVEAALDGTFSAEGVDLTLKMEPPLRSLP
jgi:hypothetical protein